MGRFERGSELRSNVECKLNALFQREAGWSHPAPGDTLQVIESLLVSLIKPSESVLVPVYGPQGHTIAELCEQSGADAIVLEQKWGSAFEPEKIIRELRRRRPPLIVVAHEESGTGVRQPLEEIGRVCQELDILFVADCSATFGRVDVRSEEWHLDATIGTGYHIPALPASLTPVSYNERVLAKLQARHSGVLPFLQMRDEWSDLCKSDDETKRMLLSNYDANLTSLMNEGLAGIKQTGGIQNGPTAEHFE